MRPLYILIHKKDPYELPLFVSDSLLEMTRTYFGDKKSETIVNSIFAGANSSYKIEKIYIDKGELL